MIDHVLVGSTGIYLIDVVARRPGRDNYVRLVNDHLTFASSKTTLSIVNSYTKAKQLSRELRGIVGHPVRVRTVVAVPGWEIASQASDEVLLINEHSVGMMRGWKDERDHLSGDDVEIIQNHLAGKKDS